MAAAQEAPLPLAPTPEFVCSLTLSVFHEPVTTVRCARFAYARLRTARAHARAALHAAAARIAASVR
jgi:hypothetical protein